MNWTPSKPIPGYEGLYRVTADGRVWSEERKVRCTSRSGRDFQRVQPGGWLKQVANSAGYLKVTLTKGNVPENRYVHLLVAAAFIPNPEGKPEVNHDDGNKCNPHWTNLEWMTSSENTQHAVRNGLM